MNASVESTGVRAGVAPGFVLLMLVLILLHIYVSIRFYSIAQQKGHNSLKYFWLTLFLGVVGMLMVNALPDVASTNRIIDAIVSSKSKQGNYNSNYKAY